MKIHTGTSPEDMQKSFNLRNLVFFLEVCKEICIFASKIR